MLRYNAARLREDADCRQVAEYIGMQVKGKFCECVSGTHSETQINHCGIYPNHIHCFSCGLDVGVIGMVQAYYKNVLGTPIAYHEACRIVGDACGGSDLYLEQSSGEKTERMPFDKDELTLLKLDTPYSGKESVHISMQSLYRENKELYYKIIRDKAAEEQEKLQKLEEQLGNTAPEASIRNVIETRLIRLRDIEKRAGGVVPILPIFKL